jgi:hypothetical protein
VYPVRGISRASRHHIHTVRHTPEEAGEAEDEFDDIHNTQIPETGNPKPAGKFILIFIFPPHSSL